ncbi:coiled-coil domain-containing protein [Arthrobacter cryoconiti]|uniref:Coiled-coil domain-containing protein n=1 Tax=Arthrobacter cryoconiti TaxID=748907 RepID=A0ABV8R316_9MICC|nr:hypothetical protein [Arthrobacter cryoconiti]MCC9067244.1 hypothetical protein [Arthrobacter cryoconiti]
MTYPSRHRLRLLAACAAAGFFAVSLTAIGPAAADDAPPSGFPSWSDVQQAKGNASATQAEVAKIGALLQGLSAESDTLGTAAVRAGASYASTKSELDAVAAQVSVLQARSGRAEKDAAKYQKDVAAVAAQRYKSGGADLGIFNTFVALGSTDSLQGLDILTQVGDAAAAKQVKAKDAQAVALSLSKARQAAELEQAKLTGVAKGELDAAVSAQQAVTEQLAARQAQSTTLTAQLASLNNTSSAVEQEYQQGQVALAAYQAAQAAKQKAADEAARAAAARAAAAQPQPQPQTPDAGSGGWIPPEILLPNIPGGAVNDPAGAQAYASSRLGAYGWGQSEFSCLVRLWTQESSWLTNATNPSSGAYGIAQSLPPGKYSSAGNDWLTNYRTQIEWGLGYIRDRYGSPCGAWAHEVSIGWY